MHRVSERAEQVAAEEAVPWAARDPSTQACAIIYGVLQINKVHHSTVCALLCSHRSSSSSSSSSCDSMLF